MQVSGCERWSLTGEDRWRLFGKTGASWRHSPVVTTGKNLPVIAVRARLEAGHPYSAPDSTVTSRATLMRATDLAAWFPLQRSGRPLRSEPISNDEWIAQLSARGPERDAAVARLHDLMIRSAWHQISRMPEAAGLGARRREEIVQAAADEAAMAVLTRLDSFEGRSRFTTWAYKFGILHTAVEVRRSAWRGREIDLDSIPEPSATGARPEDYAEAKDLGHAVREAMESALTPHQRRVALALLVDEVPIDVLADRLGTNRNALYKTLHDSRKALRAHLAAGGFLSSNPNHHAEKVIR